MSDVRPCPRDGETLTSQAIGPARPFVCSRCNGLWLSRGDLESFLDSPYETWKLPPAEGRPIALGYPATARCLCPAGADMSTVTRDGVWIDICPECGGIWLDGGEIQRLVEAAEEERKRKLGDDFAGIFVLEVLADFLGRLFRSS
jgi:Zn-finger nucleic acid-binding protein